MEWKKITVIYAAENIMLDRFKQQAGYSLIFKHSTRCSVSSMAKRRFELDWDAIPAGTYFILFRSNQLSRHFCADS